MDDRRVRYSNILKRMEKSFQPVNKIELLLFRVLKIVVKIEVNIELIRCYVSTGDVGRTYGYPASGRIIFSWFPPESGTYSRRGGAR